ncbi:MAG: hypothetical protein NVS2B7_11940 [Herpetosiphon sp.]
MTGYNGRRGTLRSSEMQVARRLYSMADGVIGILKTGGNSLMFTKKDQLWTLSRSGVEELHLAFQVIIMHYGLSVDT